MSHSVSCPFILTLAVLLSLFFIKIICTTNHAMEVVPERVEVTYQNEKYMKNLKSFIRRNGRRGPYVYHLECDILQEFGNNVSLSMILHEYLHNEYRRSFVEFHFLFCDFINKDNFLGPVIRNLGFTCPLSKGHWNISNTRIQFPVFPYVFPFKRAKSEATLTVTATGEIIATGNYYILFKQN